MQSLYILLPVALLFCVIAVAAWFWAVNSGQYDDLDKDGSSILFDDDDNDLPATRKTGDGASVTSSSQKSIDSNEASQSSKTDTQQKSLGEPGNDA